MNAYEAVKAIDNSDGSPQSSFERKNIDRQSCSTLS